MEMLNHSVAGGAMMGQEEGRGLKERKERKERSERREGGVTRREDDAGRA